MGFYVRGASFGSVLRAVDSSLTVPNCWPVPYIYLCVLCDRVADEVPRAHTVLGTEQMSA